MNFRRGLRRRAPSTLDMTPLVDVVFQLLIFFLLTSTYVQQSENNNASVPVELPESSLSSNEQPPDELVISVDESGVIFVGDEQVNLDGLAERLTRVASRKPDTIVLVRGDQRVPYGRIGQVMSIVRASGLRMSAALESGP